MNAQAPQLDEPERPRAATMKFTYPSGSRPLEGYTIKRGVGRGGFGEVYFATSDAGKEVALKLIRRNLDVELRGVTQCLNLKHPNLIALYDIRTDEMGDQWVVMEYVSGESLEDVIDQNPTGLPIEQVLWWMRGLCAGVAYLHDHGIVHRDLKPGNIFSDEGTVKIGDYGLAKFISCSRRSGQTESVGTVHYMAPEIANGRYGREIDTYALGIILFEMLTGHVPFEGESVGEVLMKHLTAEPDLSALEQPYRDIVKLALAKDPNVRLKSVAELIALLPCGLGEAPPVIVRQIVPPDPQPAPVSPAIENAQTAASQPQPLFGSWQNASPIHASAASNKAAQHGTVEEPIAKAIRTGWQYVQNRWRGEGAPPLTRRQRVGLVLAVLVLITWLSGSTHSTGQLIIQCFIVYGIYYAVWASLIRPKLRQQMGEAGFRPNPPPAPKPAPPSEQVTAAWNPGEYVADTTQRLTKETERRRVRANWRDRANELLAARPLRQKFTELSGSMLLAAVFSAIAACVVPLLSGNQSSSEITAMYLWLTIVGTLGSWAILVPSKFVEGKLEDQVPMRVTLMLLGALVGVAAWGIADAFVLETPGWREPVDVGRGLLSHEMLRWPKGDAGANPPIQIYVAYFAFLFLLPRWWRQTEYTRGSRMSLWCAMTCVFTAWLLHIFWWFPQPMGMITAGVIAISTQLASPWMPPSKRKALSEAPAQV